MQLTLHKEHIGDCALIRCQGRIVVGEEIRALQLLVEPLSRQTKKVILHLAEVSFIDSAGVGTIVRLFGILRAHGSDLILCELSPFVKRVLEITKLLGVLPVYALEQEAIRCAPGIAQASKGGSAPAKIGIVCADSSHDVLAYLSAVLERSGYDVLTTRHPSDALTLVKVTKPKLLICGPGIQTNPVAIDKLRGGAAGVRFLLLPPDFSAAEAGEAGTNLVDQVRSLIAAKE